MMPDDTGFAGQPGPAPRQAEFLTGATQTGDVATSVGQDPAMNLSSAQFMAQVPKSAGQTSVLQSPMTRSANGMSAQDYSRVLPGLQNPLPSPNGFSTQSYAQALYMRLQGLDEG